MTFRSAAGRGTIGPMETVPIPPADVTRPPLLASRYVVKGRLGRGGTCSAYLVYDLSLRTWRAIKLMHASAAADADLRHRFLREAVAMANLSHPNIVRVVDVAQDVEVPYMVMELVEGGSLYQWVKRHRRMETTVALDAAAQLCAALTAVHAVGIVHRDVKPHNVLVDREGTCKLTDFGIARLPATADLPEVDQDHVTQVGTVMGTASFMAPEQRVDATSVDARADLYAVGATLYTLVTGRAAPDLALLSPTDDKILALPPMLAPLVMRACAFRPEDRYADAAAMRDALLRVRRRMGAPPEGAEPLARDLPVLPNAPPRTVDPGDGDVIRELLETGAVTGTFVEVSGGRMVSIPPVSLAPATVPPAPLRAAPDLLRLVAPVAGAVVVGGVLFVAAALFVASGARRVATAERVAEEARERFEGVLEHHTPIVSDLVALGASRGPLEAAVARFDTAAPSERAAAASALYDLLEGQTHEFREEAESSRGMALAAMSDIRRSRDEYTRAYATWAQAAGSPNGRAAVAVGLADAPPPGAGR